MLSITSVQQWLPEGRDTAAAAIAEGRADPAVRDRDGYVELSVCSDQSAPQMAVAAAEKALSDAGLAPESIGLVVHAWTHYQGHDFWSPAHFVAAGIGALRAVPIGVQQMCNGGAAAIQIAADRLAADPGLTAALVTTADRFDTSTFDRWRGDYGVAYGDGATALVLSRESGPYSLVSLATAAAPALEWMHRGVDPFGSKPMERGARIDVRRTKKAFLEAGCGPKFAAEVGNAVRSVITEALGRAGLDPADSALRHVALPRLGRSVLARAYHPALNDFLPAEPLDFGGDTGHLGAGDAAANLAVLHSKQLLKPGEYTLLLSAGAGFTWSCLLVRAN